MLRMAVDPEQHPVDQYRYDSEWSEIIQYLSLLYLHSKLPYYKKVGKATWFHDKMRLYRDLDMWSHEFKKFLGEVLDAKEYTKVVGLLDNAHGSIKNKMFKPIHLRSAFRNIHDDLPHVHSVRIKAVLKPLVAYFKNGAEPMVDRETEALEGMKKIRNPRLKRVLIQVETDLIAMSADEIELKASSDDIRSMSTVERLTLTRDTKDDDTLDSLFEVAKELEERSIYGILFMRGYRRGNAPRIYLENRLATLGNLKKLSDDILYDWLTDMPWNWADKFNGVNNWRWLYEELLPRRPDLMIRMFDVRGSLKYQTEFLRVVGENLPVDDMTSDMIAAVWEYVDDPASLVRWLDKDTRIAKFNRRKLASVWLFDLTKAELVPFLQEGDLREESFISSRFGADWGALTAPGNDLDTNDTITIKRWFSNLSVEDVAIVKGFQRWGRRFVADLDGYVIRNRTGGTATFIRDVYSAASDPGKALLISLLNSKYLRMLEGMGGLDSATQQAIEDSKVAEEAEKDAEYQALLATHGTPNSFPTSTWKKTLRRLPPADVTAVFKAWIGRIVAGEYYGYRDALENIYVERAPVSDLLDAIADPPLGDRERLLTSTATLKVALSRLPSTAALQLVRSEEGVVRHWVVENYPADHLIDLMKANENYQKSGSVCRMASRLPTADVPAAMALVTTYYGTSAQSHLTVKRDKAVACLVAQMDVATDAYLTGDYSEKVMKASVPGATKDAVIAALGSTSHDIFVEALERDDAVLHVSEYVSADLGHPNSTVNSASYVKLDELVPKLNDTQFKDLVRHVSSELDAGAITQRHRKVWGVFTYQKFTGLSGTDDDMAQDIESRSALDQSFYSFNKELTTPKAMWELMKKGRRSKTPLPKMGIYLRKLFGDLYHDDTKWLALLTDAQLDWYTTYNYDEDAISYTSRRAYINYKTQRDKETRGKVQGDMLQQVNTAFDAKDYPAVAQALSDGYDMNITAATNLIKNIYTKTKEEDLKVNIITHANDKLLDALSVNNVISSAMVVTYASDEYMVGALPKYVQRHMRDPLEIAGNDPNIAARQNTRMKVALIERATADQALDLFKFYAKEQKQFGNPPVIDAFLSKLDDDKFKALLVKYLLSKEYTLRVKKITLQMLPLVLKIDEDKVTDKFNRSSVFHQKAIGGLGPHWDGLTTKAEKRDFLDSLKDRAMAEKLLKILIERLVPLGTPLNRKFSLGSNSTSTASFLKHLSMAHKTTTHGELFWSSVKLATTDELKDWIITNPLQVFDYEMPVDDSSTAKLRVDATPKAEAAKVEKQFKANWSGARRNIRGDILGVYKVIKPHKPLRTSNNLKTLYHGTDYLVSGLIIQGHFKVMKHHKAGRMLGDGIYFSDVGSKVAQYISKSAFGHSRDQGVILVCEIDLGNMLTLDASTDYLRYRDWKGMGYDSIFWPKRDGGGYGGRDSEYCVADVNRIKILYAIHLDRVPT